jgi:murein DD-endopeptidase MepM/ murein hydrolase activator NlpD
MANNAKVTLTFDIQEDGSVKLVAKNLKDLNKATQTNSKVTRDAGKASDELNYKLKQGVTGVSSAGRSFSKLSQAIGEGPNGLVGAYATLAANAFAVSAAFNTLKNAKQAEQLLQGLEAQGARTGRTLTTVSAQVKELSGASLSSAEAMRAVAQASTAGINTSDIERLTAVATASARALGRDVPDSLNRLIMAVSKAEPELVDELGLTIKLTEAMDMYAREVGKTATNLTRLERQQALINAWATQGEVKFSALAESVDPNPYDQLAAAFSDLSNSILGFINNAGVASFVSFLANDKLALTAALIFFVSTIKNQVVPGIAEAANAAKKLSEVRLGELTKEKDRLLEVQGTLASHKKANEEMISSLSEVKRMPKYYKEWVDLEKQGVDAVEKRTAAQEGLTSSMKRFEARAKSAAAKGDIEGAESFRAKAAARAQDLANMQSYVDKRDQVQSGLAAAAAESAALERETILKTSQIQAQSSRADAITSLSKFELRASYSALIISTKAYQAALVQEIILKGELAGVTNASALANTALNRSLVLGRTALFAAATGVKALGAAVLTWLPYLGLAVLAWDALTAIWDTLKPDVWKKQEAAFDELSEAIEGTTKKFEAYNQIENRAGEISQKAETLLINRTNTLKEALETYDAYNRALEQAQESEQTSSLRLKELGGDFLILTPGLAAARYAWNLWADSTNKELGIPLDSLTNEIFKITPLSSDAEKATASLLAAMEKGLPATTKKFIELNEKFKDLDSATRQNLIRQWAESIRPAMEIAAKAVDELSGALGQLSNDWADFIRSIGTTTPYDNLIGSIDATVRSLGTFRSQITSGIFEQEDVDVMLKQISEASARLPASILGGVGLEIRDTIQTTDDALVKLRIRQSEFQQGTAEYKNLATSIKSLEADRVQLAQRLGVEANKNLGTLQATVNQAQLDSITAQANLALAQARLGVVQRQGKISAEDVKREIDAKNRIVALQVAQIQANRVFLQMEVDKRKLELEAAVRRAKELEDTAKLNQLGLEGYLQLLKVQQLSLNSQVQTAESVKRLSEVNKEISLIERQGTSAENIKSKAEEASQQVEAAKRAVALSEAVLAANDAQAAAAALGAVTNAERLYEIGTQVLSNDRERYALERQLNDTKLVQLRQSTQLLDIENSGVGELTRRIQVLKEEFKLRRTDEQKQTDFRKTELALAIAKASAEGRNEAVEILIARKKLLEEEIILRNKNITAEERLALFAEIDLNTADKKIELLSRSLEVYRKQADLQSTTLDKEQELFKLRVQNARSGVPLGETAERSVDLRALKQQLELAKQQLDLKKLGIKLEYDLLEAQRLLLVDQLRAKAAEARQLAASATAGPAQDAATRIADTLDNAITNLANSSYAALRDNAIRIADLDIKILEERAKFAYNEIIGAFLNDVLGRNNPAFALLNAIDDTAVIIRNLQEGKSVAQATTKLSPDTTAQVGALELNTSATVDLTNALLNVPTMGTTQAPINVETTLKAADAKSAAAAVAPELVREWTRLQPFRSEFGQTSGYGMRTHPITGTRRMHAGRDFAYPAGSPLRAQEAGIVGFVGKLGDYGNVVDVYVGEMENGIKVFRRFAHLMDATVKVGQRVEAGELLGRTGSTGLSSGPHLHEEVRVGRAGAGTAMNPADRPLIQSYGTTASNDNEIVVLGRSITTEFRSEAQMWSDIIKNARTEIAGTSDEIRLSFIESLAAISPTITAMSEQLKTLGPQGEAVAAISEGMMTIAASVATAAQAIGESYGEYLGTAIDQILEDGQVTNKELASLQDASEHTAAKMAAAFSAASAVIGSVASILNASSKARIDNIDREISAEQRRDGKSQESLAKIDAMEKRKDGIARKSFNTNKKLQMAQAVMSTAAGVAGVLAQSAVYGPILTPILAGMIGAMGLAQIAIISGTQYQSSYSPQAIQTPSALSIGRRSDTVNLASGPNASAGGESAFLRGSAGTGRNASNFIGSAYGGNLMRGFGNTGFIVGEKGPEVITPETPINVTPANENSASSPVNATINIQAIDSQGVQDVLVSQKGNIIQMLRQAANANGQRFLEDVNVNVYTRPSVGKLL